MLRFSFPQSSTFKLYLSILRLCNIHYAMELTLISHILLNHVETCISAVVLDNSTMQDKETLQSSLSCVENCIYHSKNEHNNHNCDKLHYIQTILLSTLLKQQCLSDELFVLYHGVLTRVLHTYKHPIMAHTSQTVLN